MKNYQPKKLFAFIVSIVIWMMFSSSANAQIIYTVNTSGGGGIDLNNDGINDFSISHSTSTATSTNCGSKLNNFIKVSPTGSNQIVGNASKMVSNTFIDVSLTWNSSANQLMASYVWHANGMCYWSGSVAGAWAGISTGCLGLKLIVGGNTYYGWASVSTTVYSSSFTINSYAYNSIPNQGIFPGQSTNEFIVTSPIVTTALCAGGNVSVPYIIMGTFSPSNVVTAQLSDGTGYFSNPVAIGSVVSNVSGSINAIIPSATIAGTAYRIRVTSSNPSKTSSSNGSDLIVTTGVPSGTITANGSTNLCNGNVSMVASSVSSNSFQWKLNGNNISGAAFYYYSATMTGNYSCVITNGCGSITSNIISVTSSAVPLTITSGTTTVCGGSVYMSTASVAGNTYQWLLNGNNILNATSYSYSAAATGNYSCVKTNSCGSVTSNVISVTVNTVPVATITVSGSAEVCPGSAVTLNANTGAGLTYQWYKNYVSIAGATASSYIADTSASYYVRVTNSFGCVASSSSKVITVRIPQSSISNSRPLTFCAGDSTVLSTVNTAGFLYQWKKNNANIAGATSYKYTAFTSGKYKVKVTNPNGNCDSISKTKKVTVNCRIADENFEISNQLSVYPNPATNSVTLKFPSDERGEIQIVNLFGQVVFSEKINQEQTQIDVSRFSEGMYVVRWSSGENFETKTFSVTK